MIVLLKVVLLSGDCMGAVFFTREVTDAMVQIAYELKRMNDLKEKELKLKYALEDLDV